MSYATMTLPELEREIAEADESYHNCLRFYHAVFSVKPRSLLFMQAAGEQIEIRADLQAAIEPHLSAARAAAKGV